MRLLSSTELLTASGSRLLVGCFGEAGGARGEAGRGDGGRGLAALFGMGTPSRMVK